MDVEHLPDGTTRLRDEACTFIFKRMRPGMLCVEVKGRDKGQFGTAPLDQLRAEIQRFGSLTLFIDAEQGAATGLGVTEMWRDFFKANKNSIESVSVLVGSRYMEFMVSVALHLANMGRVVTITTDRDVFEHNLTRQREAAPS
jgi:hypothetical protein